MSKPKTRTQIINRDAITGRFITEKEAKKNPDTSVEEKNKIDISKKPTKKKK